MAALFLDTSALVRRYDRGEAGSGKVVALCLPANGHTLLLARITRVEVASALGRKVREGRLGQPLMQRLWTLFLAHWRDQYRVVALDEATYERAEQLLFAHPLWAYDALQLACALRTAALLADVTDDFRFCTADRAQGDAATREGLVLETVP